MTESVTILFLYWELRKLCIVIEQEMLYGEYLHLMQSNKHELH